MFSCTFSYTQTQQGKLYFPVRAFMKDFFLLTTINYQIGWAVW